MTQSLTLLRLLLITVLAGCIGYERERHGRAAGLRTHILVGVGSCLIMLTAMDLMERLAGRVTVDPTRLAAQVVSGIGFLGAGTILRFRASVRGLTTAASLWAVAAIGLAVGSGFAFGATTATIIVLVALFGFSRLERRLRKDWYRTLVIESRGSSEDLVRLRAVLSEYDVEIRDFNVRRTDQPEVSRLELDLKLLSGADEEPILRAVEHLEGMHRARWA